MFKMLETSENIQSTLIALVADAVVENTGNAKDMEGARAEEGIAVEVASEGSGGDTEYASACAWNIR